MLAKSAGAKIDMANVFDIATTALKNVAKSDRWLYVWIHNTEFMLSQTSSMRFQPIRIRVDVAGVTVGHLSLAISSQFRFLSKFTEASAKKQFCLQPRQQGNS